ncbi:DUF4326 domain-containing protein [Defluviimonas sp. SAOS-178_SWC]|uniref:DUF4326 domain-containing protein n=1 Tax=Defluviimonas sp. SAOS-178_SWC TaxID=3121287 RepID=UPI00322160C0
MAERVQLRRTKGWRMPENTVKVDRSTQWGNPFAIGTIRCSGKGKTFLEETVTSREVSMRFFRDLLSYRRRPYPTDEEIKTKLRGKNLACWCPLGEPCHADVLLEIANRAEAG